MRVEHLHTLKHPEFRVTAQLRERGELVDIYLVPRNGVVFEKRLSATLIQNTPEDGVLALLERYWDLEKNHHSPLHSAAPDLLVALELMMDAPGSIAAMRTACKAIARARGRA